ncbi:MAG: single-stranded-DNA-specific exonuclease RecJ [Oscillospiraceae bacterium]
MTQRNWNIAGYERGDVIGLVKRGFSCLLSVLLTSRRITSEEKIKALMECDTRSIPDPYLMKDMDRAVKRLEKAIEEKEHVAVYGDYDVDGITSSCLVASYLRSRGLTCEIYIPERFEEGYGVKNCGLTALAAMGVTLTVTVDCGITAFEESAYARSLGMDMVITDHHECAEKLPEAAAVINPKRRDRLYPYPYLAGVGVAFKLICGLEGRENTEALLEKYGDLVAVGTIADVMPVTGENRILIKRGIDAIKSGSRPGLKKLCKAVGAELSQISSQNISFMLAPRLNAAGRLGYTDVAVDLLLTESEDRADKLSAELCELNKKRQQFECMMYEEALSMLEGEIPAGEPIILAKNGWHQGVAGIVASRLSEKFRVPVVMICLSDGVGRGSCRSFGGFNLFGALEESRGFLQTFGGHEMAAGLTISECEIDGFRKKLKELYAKKNEALAEAFLNIDFEVINPGILSLPNVESLSLLEPYGNGNPTPVLCIKGAFVDLVTPMCGGKHTKYRIKKDGEPFDCIFFSKNAEELGVSSGDSVDIVFAPQINEFRGRRSVQLLMLDIIKRDIKG